MQQQSKKRWLNIAIVVIVLGTLAATAWYYFSQCDSFDCPSIAEFIAGFGPWSLAAYAVMYIISSPVPFLAPVLSTVGGLLFGAILGTVYTVVIATVSAFVPFFLARRLGREWVESKLRGRRLDEIYQQSGSSQGLWFVLLMRAIPILPWEVQNYVAGLTKVSVLAFLLGTMIGIIPGTFSLVFLGASVTAPDPWQRYAAIALKVVTALVPIVAIYIRNRRDRRRGDKGTSDKVTGEDEEEGYEMGRPGI
jgi:uncharacterized membrane protein YdjX (TVP38/TMEM64 family)